MAEGDKVVPSEGNSRLDPTKKISGALNQRLGITGGSLTGEKTRSGSLSSSNWIRNQNGVLVHSQDLDANVSQMETLNRFSKKYDNGVKSADILRDRAQKERVSVYGEQDFQKRGSSQGDEQAGDEEGSSPTIYSQPSGGIPSSNFSIGPVQSSFSKIPTLKEMMEMPIAQVAIVGTGKRFCGPAVIGTMNFNGAMIQTNTHEAMMTGGGINLEPIG